MDRRTAVYLKDPNGYSEAARSAALLYPLGYTRAYARVYPWHGSMCTSDNSSVVSGCGGPVD